MEAIRRANFIVGFSNWGKTTLVNELFGRKRYYYDKTYRLAGIPAQFVVQSQSNDDLGSAFVKRVEIRLTNTASLKPDLFAALCPAMDHWNNYIEILQNDVFNDFDEFNLFLIKYKWEHHAELRIKDIENSCKHISGINCIVIDADQNLPVQQRLAAKRDQVIRELALIY